MPGLGMQELVVILVVVLVIFGAGKVPQIMKQLGSGVRELKHLDGEMKETVRDLNRPDRF